MIDVPAPIKPLPLKTSDVNLWVNGVNTEVDALRLGVSALSSAYNMLLDQDGLLRERPSLILYGPQPTGTILGKPQKFVTNTGTQITSWMISVQVIDGTSVVCVAKPEDTSWTQCSGGVFSTTASCTFTQLGQSPMVTIHNGVDALAYLDLTTIDDDTPTVTQMEAIDDPTTAPTLASSGFSGTDIATISYAYTCNSTTGETLPSDIATINLPADRPNWTSSQYVNVTAPTLPSGAESWNLYAASVGEGGTATELFLLAAGLSTSNLTYQDNGQISLITNTSPPLANTTSGPAAKGSVVIGGILFCYQDANNPYCISIGSQIPGYELDFSPAHGGDILAIESGSGSLPMIVWNFRSGTGDPEIKVLTQDTGGIGKRHTLSQSTLTYNGTEITVWGYQEDYGFNGTVASNSLVAFNNSTYYLGYDGFYQSGTEPELQNLLDTHNNSIVISPDDFLSINQAAVGLVDGSVWQNRLYWCVPVGTDYNNQIWTLDLQRGNAWMKPWNIECQGITIITDNSGLNHQLFLVNNQLMESSYQALTSDNGVTFTTGFGTAAIGFSSDLRTWSQVIMVLVVLLRAQGTVTFTVVGWTDDNQLEEVGSATFNADAEGWGYGWNEDGWNQGNLLAWNQFNVPTLSVQESVDVDINIGQRIRFFFVYGSSTTPNTDYSVANIIPLFTVVGVENLQ